MEIKNINMLVLGIVFFSIVNIIWVYLFTWTGIKFDDVFDPKIVFRFTGEGASGLIFLLLAIGFLMALSISLVRLFSQYLNQMEKNIMVVSGVTIAILTCLSSYTNLLVFVIIMLFYMIGCLLLAKVGESKGLFSKLSSSFNASKKVVTILTIGSLVASFLFIAMNPTESQSKFKESMLSFQSSINIGSLITKDDVRNLVANQLQTKDQIRDLLINGSVTQIAADRGISEDDVRNDATLMALIESQVDSRVDSVYQAQYDSLDKTIDQTYAKMSNSSSALMRPIMEKMFAKPPFSYLFDFMPVLIAVLVASMVSLFGAVWIAPMAAVIGAFLPDRPNSPVEPPKPPQANK